MTLRKAELIDLANANDVWVDESNTVAEIKEALDSADVDYSDTRAVEAEAKEPEFPPGVDDGVARESIGNAAQRAKELAQEGES